MKYFQIISMQIMSINLLRCAIALAIWGCSDIKGPELVDLSQSELLYKFRFTTKAVMIANYDTLTLRTVAIFADSSRVTIDPIDISWRSTDNNVVYVDSIGKIRTLASTTAVTNIIAMYTVNGITKGDTISVYVTPTKMNANDIRIEVLDSTAVGALAVNGTPKIRVDLYNNGVLLQEGARVPLTVPLGISASTVAVVGSPGVFWNMILNNKGILGKFYIHTSLNLYGNEVRDSVEFTGVYPAALNLPPIVQNMNGEVTAPALKPDSPMQYVQPCAVVKFLLALPLLTRPVDIVFSDSTPSDGKTCQEISDADIKSGSIPVRVNRVWGNATEILGQNIGFVTVVRRSPTIGEVRFYLRDAITRDSLGVSGRYTQK